MKEVFGAVLSVKDNVSGVMKQAKESTRGYRGEVEKTKKELEKLDKKKIREKELKIKNSEAYKAIEGVKKKLQPLAKKTIEIQAKTEHKDTTYNPATTGTNGLMSAADKAKLDGIAEGANNYSHPKTHAATMIVQDAEHRFVSDVDKQGWSDKYTKNEVDNKLSALETKIDWKEAVKTFADIAKTYPNPEDGWTVNVKDDDVTYRYTGNEWVAISANSIPLATKDLDGRMSKSDKAKLDGIAAGANNYTHPDTSGNKHIPAGGASGQVLGWSADGQAKWVEDKDTTYSPATTATNGLMSAADKAKLDGVAEGANNYTHPEHHPATVITEDDNHQFVTKAQKEAIDNMPSIGFGREYPQEAAPNSLFFLIG